LYLSPQPSLLPPPRKGVVSLALEGRVAAANSEFRTLASEFRIVRVSSGLLCEQPSRLLAPLLGRLLRGLPPELFSLQSAEESREQRPLHSPEQIAGFPAEWQSGFTGGLLPRQPARLWTRFLPGQLRRQPSGLRTEESSRRFGWLSGGRGCRVGPIELKPLHYRDLARKTAARYCRRISLQTRSRTMLQTPLSGSAFSLFRA